MIPKVHRSMLIYAFGLPADLAGALAALIIGALAGKGRQRLRIERVGRLSALAVHVPWMPGRFDAITIAPHVIAYRDWDSPIRLRNHEHIHCEQYEVSGLVGFVLAAFSIVLKCPISMSLVVWLITPWLHMLAGYVIAWLRGEDPYSGSLNERAAYALERTEKTGSLK